MNYLSIENVSKTYGEKNLFQNVSMGLDKGQKTAIIARNGRGKTTLMQIIMGSVLPDKGKVTLRKDIKVAYLSQSPEIDPNQSLIDFLLSSQNETTDILRRYEELLEKMTKDNSPALQKEMEDIISVMDHLQAWNYEERVKEVLFRLQLTSLQQPMGQLSGGQQKKASLAKVLLSNADLLLLDEPTNHLDLSMIEWLEEFLNRQNISLLLVTHDRAFLDAVCSDIVEIDAQQTYYYKGNYSYFLEKKAERESIAISEWEKAKNLYKRELEWVRRMPSARGTKAKARIDAFEELKDKISFRPNEDKVELNIKSERLGNKIMEVNNITKSYGNKLLINDFSYTFKKGEKIGIVGANGSGKSTFLNMLVGNIKPDSGHIIVGQTIQFGYYEQSGLWVPGEKRVIDIIKEVAEVVKTEQGKEISASQFLQYFQFDPTTQYNYFSNLSGGERRRLYLLKTLMAHPNFLILDEPTNDLDVFTLMLLEDFLSKYEGCVLMVSHDRSFMEHIADHTFIFEEDGNIKDFYGSYSEYKKKKNSEIKRLASEASAKSEHLSSTTALKNKDVSDFDSAKPIKKKPSYKQQKEIDSLESEIKRLETRKIEIEEILSNPTDIDNTHINELSQEIGQISESIDCFELKWLEITDQLDI